MEDVALLTDDEIVALCAADGRPWPIGLNTVETTAQELSRAGMRGMRSLMVRRLAGGDAEAEGVRPHEMIARDVAAFLDATDRVGAYMARASDPAVLGGAAITAARTDTGWILDTATAAGVHALRQASTEEVTVAVLDIAERIYEGTLFTEEPDRAAWVCVLRFGSDAQNTLAIGHQSVTGEVNGAPVNRWNKQLVLDALQQY